MDVIEGSGNFSPPGETSLTIGNFDGVHLGHRELLRRTVAHARNFRLQAVTLTSTGSRFASFTPRARFYEITSMGEKRPGWRSSGSTSWSSNRSPGRSAGWDRRDHPYGRT